MYAIFFKTLLFEKTLEKINLEGKMKNWMFDQAKQVL